MTKHPQRSLSLNQRLSLLFAGISVLLLASVGFFLHHSLTMQFRLRDTQDLNGKIELVRHALLDIGTVDAIRSSPARWLDIVIGHHGLQLAIFDQEREVVLASEGLSFPARVLDAVASDITQYTPMQEWIGENGTPYRAALAWSPVGRSRETSVLVGFAIDVSQEQKLLAAYRTSIMGAVLIGTLLAALLGAWAARQGLAPLQIVARAADRITASRLDERLDVSLVPRELEALARAYNAMLERLQDSFSRLTQFSSDLAHDLRTPIGNILGESQVALSKARSADEYRSVIESGVEELERISRMIESMLFLARADHAQLALHPEHIRLDTELQTIRSYFEPLAQEKSIAIEVASSDPVYADPTLLRRAISNLVANAIRFTPNKGGPITLSSRRTVRGDSEICVTNPGPEIPSHERERVFDRFYRAGQARSDSAASSGLGLAIVKSIVTLHAGRAALDCNAGKTTFTLTFPPQRDSEHPRS